MPITCTFPTHYMSASCEGGIYCKSTADVLWPTCLYYMWNATQFVQLARPVPCHSFEAVSRGAASCFSSVLEYSDLSAADHTAALLKLCTSVLPIAGAVILPDPTTTSPHLVILLVSSRLAGSRPHLLEDSVHMDTVVNPLKDFAKNSVRLVKRCTKPDRRGADASCIAYGLI